MLVQNWDMVRHTEGQLTPQKYPSLSKISPPTPVKTRQRLHRRIPLILPLHPPYWIVTNGAVRRCWIRRGNQPVLVLEYLPLSPDMTKKPPKWIQIPAQDLAPLVTGILEIDFERTVHFRASSEVSLLQHWGKTLKKSILERWDNWTYLFNRLFQFRWVYHLYHAYTCTCMILKWQVMIMKMLEAVMSY